MTKRNVVIAIVAAMTIFASTSLFAQGRGPGGYGDGFGGPGFGGCPGIEQNLTAEQQATMDTLFEEFKTNTETMREDMWAKHTELQAIGAGSNQERISTLITEMRAIRAQMKAAKDALDAKLEAAGINFKQLCGPRGGRGKRGGNGQGGPRGGCGNCPGYANGTTTAQ